VIEHVHGGGEEHALISLAGTPADDFRQHGFADTRIADKNGAGSFVQKLQIEQPQDAGFRFQARLVMFEVEAVYGVLGIQPGEAEPALDGTAVARSSSRSAKDSNA
jgi:hypothetical protein